MSNKFVIPSRFIVSIFGELQPVKENPMLSKARLRIFYKYVNRNQTYISDEIADYLIQNIGGTPIVGWYDPETKDFKEHGDVNQTRAYGFVPLETNFAWEKHLDEDGVEREYACVDVMLFTGRYEEAKQIINKSHSMELDPSTISGQWGVMEGLQIFAYSHALIYGLCVLGENYDPCFEGSAFFTNNSKPEDTHQLVEVLNTMREEIQSQFSNNTVKKPVGGKAIMKLFKLSHDDIFVKLWYALNPNFTEEGEFVIDCDISQVFDTYVLMFDYEAKETYRVSYSVENDVVKLGDKEKVFIVDVTEAEYTALQTIQTLQESFSLAADTLKDYTEQAEAFAAFKSAQPVDVTQYTTKISTHEATIQTLKTALANYEKAEKDRNDQAKTDLIEMYSSKLGEDVIKEYSDNKDSYSFDELEAKLAVAFAKTQSDFSLYHSKVTVPNGGRGDANALTQLLEKYVED